ncbi:MAG: PPOX class F420-dependent oxidoreductase [Anaerolineae bacterium]|jgi:PPOX class probable F420-dependent enzyme|nr:PPOX class F420-dependent oxidoreductase [Anaerolineae bacterium]MBT4309864.1 PPOX class F420-dependent oxidoreductase [Anaerolineae bacterium]MBT4457521.1 PPOX class F420-dependent oxidoreductase [Anaerolineae bacterium]MBT4843614.1 PPOX class F420-dependent oxidoreductase [Anaerolineae bacterium]MBT6060770.1 PPOX class F420-dependent oxidoreductase [Anaerolineae bacterium]
MNIPENYQDLLKDDTKAYLFLATIMADGTPQVTPVWFSAEENYILINTAAGRIKDHNMQARPHVAMVIQDPNDPYRYMQIRGKIAERTTEGAVAHIHALSQKYMGKDWNIPAGEERVIFKISIDKVSGH